MGEARGWLGTLQGACGPAQTVVFRSDRVTDPVLTDEQLRAFATGGAGLTYTCVPPGSGMRIALDRDEDGAFDRDELDAGTDPADPLSVPPPPGLGVTTLATSTQIKIKDRPDDTEAKRQVVIRGRDAALVAPVPGSTDDPRCNGDPSGTIKLSLVVSSGSSGQVHRTDLACQYWSAVGSAGNPHGYRYADPKLAAGTVKSARWANGRFDLKLSGKGPFFLDYDLVPGVSQDTVDVVLVGETGSVCLACPPYGASDGSNGTSFLGRLCGPPATCGRR